MKGGGVAGLVTDREILTSIEHFRLSHVVVPHSKSDLQMI